jgi:hypothetical protein
MTSKKEGTRKQTVTRNSKIIDLIIWSDNREEDSQDKIITGLEILIEED